MPELRRRLLVRLLMPHLARRRLVLAHSPAAHDAAGPYPKEHTVTNLPYTDTDLRAEAASQHAALLEDPDFGSVGEGMQDAWVSSTLNGDDGHTWAELLPYEADGGEAYNAAQRKIHDLIPGADVSEWAVNLGADGLQPDPHHADFGHDPNGTSPLMRLHFAFHPEADATDRHALAQLATETVQDALNSALDDGPHTNPKTAR